MFKPFFICMCVKRIRGTLKGGRGKLHTTHGFTDQEQGNERMPLLVRRPNPLLYRSSLKTCIAKDKCALDEAARRVEEVCAMREADLERLHRAQREKLELEISWLPLRPRIKYTNRFLELQKTKAG